MPPTPLNTNIYDLLYPHVFIIIIIDAIVLHYCSLVVAVGVVVVDFVDEFVMALPSTQNPIYSLIHWIILLEPY